jgi:hypothetical protein
VSRVLRVFTDDVLYEDVTFGLTEVRFAVELRPRRLADWLKDGRVWRSLMPDGAALRRRRRSVRRRGPSTKVDTGGDFRVTTTFALHWFRRLVTVIVMALQLR